MAAAEDDWRDAATVREILQRADGCGFVLAATGIAARGDRESPAGIPGLER